MKALLVAAGEQKQGAWLQQSCRSAELLIAVDGGLRHLLKAGFAPQLIVGDLDSASAADLQRTAQVPRLVHPRDKEHTDLELALAEAERRGASEVVVAGALGGRQDHNLTNLLLAAGWRQRLKLSLAGAGTLVWPLAAGDSLELPGPAGTRFSVIATGPGCLVSISGARYPLDSAELPFASGLGVSNETLSRGRVSVKRGTVLVMVLSDDV